MSQIKATDALNKKVRVVEARGGAVESHEGRFRLVSDKRSVQNPHHFVKRIRSFLSAPLSTPRRTLSQLNEEINRLVPIVESSKSSSSDPDNNYEGRNTGLSQLLCTFLPNMVVDHVNKGNFKEGLEPHYTAHHCTTLLFVDISGYTSLAQKLGSEGVAGTEKLSESLDSFFNIAITSIYRHGGDVVKFCGDALMCVFLSDGQGKEKQMCGSACNCCLELQKKVRGAHRGQEPDKGRRKM